VGIVALALTVYAAYVAWPWWIAGVAGGVIGVGHFFLIETRGTPPTAGAMIAKAITSVLMYGAYTTAIYFAARWLLGAISN
jgi:hypothetical protein